MVALEREGANVTREWCMDLRDTSYYTKNNESMSEYPRSIVRQSGVGLKGIGKGIVALDMVVDGEVTAIFYVLVINDNILFVSYGLCKGCYIHILKDETIIIEKDGQVPAEPSTDMCNNVCRCHTASSTSSIVAVTTMVLSVQMWQKRLGHLALRNMKMTEHREMVGGLPKLKGA